MNLTTDPWIPVVWEGGRPGKVSLLDAFGHGHEIRDLAARPHERIALMRLLICVAQAALDGPRDRAEWRTCAERLPAAAAAYLGRWHHAFELFGDGQRFLQVADLVPMQAKTEEGPGRASKLDLGLATGNASTLFDNAGGSVRAFAPEHLAVMLLTFQNFSPCGRIGVALWAGRQTSGAGSSPHAPCAVRNAAHSLIKAASLADSLHLNLVTRDTVEHLGQQWGRPVWECMPAVGTDTDAVRNATETVLGRMVPLSRAIRLADDGTDLLLANGLAYPEMRDQMATIMIRNRGGKEERLPLGVSTARSVWRELHALTVVAKDGIGGPLCLANLHEPIDCTVWVGGMVAEGNAKVGDIIESAFHLPAEMFTATGRAIYEEGVKSAEAWSRRVYAAIAAYRQDLSDDLGRRENRDRGTVLKHKAGMHFWTAVEQRLSELLAVVEEPGLLHPGGAAEPTWSQTAWGKAVSAAARAAYELACPHQTPRQMKAYTVGLKALFHEPAAANATAEAETEEEAS